MTTTTTVRRERGVSLAADALTLATIGAVGAGYCLATGLWAAGAVIVALTVGAWFTLRACARKVSGWTDDQRKGDVDVDAS